MIQQAHNHILRSVQAFYEFNNNNRSSVEIIWQLGVNKFAIYYLGFEIRKYEGF